jgi:hypothetical protein
MGPTELIAYIKPGLDHVVYAIGYRRAAEFLGQAMSAEPRPFTAAEVVAEFAAFGEGSVAFRYHDEAPPAGTLCNLASLTTRMVGAADFLDGLVDDLIERRKALG